MRGEYLGEEAVDVRVGVVLAGEAAVAQGTLRNLEVEDLTLDAHGPAGELAIPTQVDTLELVISLADGGAPLLSRQYPLAAGSTFPQTVGIDPESLAESELAVTATALEDGGVVGSSSTLIPIPVSKVASVTMVIIAP